MTTMIAALFRDAVQDRPDHPAVCTLGPKGTVEKTLTFRQLNHVCDLKSSTVYGLFNSNEILLQGCANAWFSTSGCGR